MNISEIDKLDEYNRMRELGSKLLEETPSYCNSLLSETFEADLAALDNNSDSNNINITEEFKLAESGDNTTGDNMDIIQLIGREEKESIRKLTVALHNKDADLSSLRLQLNHVRLQLQALSDKERQSRSERDELQFLLAEAEQDKLLLETRLRRIAGFERHHSGTEETDNGSEDDIRGQLLRVANDKMKELSEALRAAEGQLEINRQQYIENTQRLNADNMAVRAELDHVCGQLAQRAVLYAAKERQLVDDMRYQKSHFDETSREAITLKAKLQQLEQRCSEIDAERMEIIFSNRQLESSKAELLAQLETTTERADALDTELAVAAAQNQQLQSTVDQLRGSDLQELEWNLTAELEKVRAEAKEREQGIQIQLQEARTLLQTEVSNREQLLDELQELRSKLNDREQLLAEIESRDVERLFNSNITNLDSNYIPDQRIIDNREGHYESSVDGGYDAVELAEEEADSWLVHHLKRDHNAEHNNKRSAVTPLRGPNVADSMEISLPADDQESSLNISVGVKHRNSLRDQSGSDNASSSRQREHRYKQSNDLVTAENEFQLDSESLNRSIRSKLSFISDFYNSFQSEDGVAGLVGAKGATDHDNTASVSSETIIIALADALAAIVNTKRLPLPGASTFDITDFKAKLKESFHTKVPLSVFTQTSEAVDYLVQILSRCFNISRNSNIEDILEGPKGTSSVSREGVLSKTFLTSMSGESSLDSTAVKPNDSSNNDQIVETSSVPSTDELKKISKHISDRAAIALKESVSKEKKHTAFVVDEDSYTARLEVELQRVKAFLAVVLQRAAHLPEPLFGKYSNHIISSCQDVKDEASTTPYHDESSGANKFSESSDQQKWQKWRQKAAVSHEHFQSIDLDYQLLSERLQSERLLHAEQLQTYREEMEHLENLAEQNLKLGQLQATELYESQIKQLEQEVHHYSERLVQETRTVEETVSARYVTQISQFEDRITEYTQKIEHLEKQLHDVKTGVETDTVALLREQLSNAQNCLEKSESALLQSEDHIKQYDRELDRLRKVESDLQDTRVLLDHAEKSKEAAVVLEKAAAQKLLLKCQAYARHTDNLTACVRDYEVRIQLLRTLHAKSSLDCVELRAQLTSAQQRSTEHECSASNFADVTAKLESSESQVLMLKNEMDRLNNDYDAEKQRLIADHKGVQHTTSAELRFNQDRCRALQQSLEVLRSDSESLREQLHQSRNTEQESRKTLEELRKLATIDEDQRLTQVGTLKEALNSATATAAYEMKMIQEHHKQELRLLEGQLKDLKVVNDSLHDENRNQAALINDNKLLEKELQRLVSEVKAQKQSMNALESELGNRAATIETLERELEQMKYQRKAEEDSYLHQIEAMKVTISESKLRGGISKGKRDVGTDAMVAYGGNEGSNILDISTETEDDLLLASIDKRLEGNGTVLAATPQLPHFDKNEVEGFREIVAALHVHMESIRDTNSLILSRLMHERYSARSSVSARESLHAELEREASRDQQSCNERVVDLTPELQPRASATARHMDGDEERRITGHVDTEVALRSELERKIEHMNDKLFALLEFTIKNQQANINSTELQNIVSSEVGDGKNKNANHSTANTGASTHADDAVIISHLQTVNQQLQQQYLDLLNRIGEQHPQYLQSSHSEKDSNQQQRYVDTADAVQRLAQANAQLQSKIEKEAALTDTIQRLQRELAEQKRYLVHHYRAKLARLQVNFESEREEMVRLVREECAEIVRETEALLILAHNNNPKASQKAVQVGCTGSADKCISQQVSEIHNLRFPSMKHNNSDAIGAVVVPPSDEATLAFKTSNSDRLSDPAHGKSDVTLRYSETSPSVSPANRRHQRHSTYNKQARQLPQYQRPPPHGNVGSDGHQSKLNKPSVDRSGSHSMHSKKGDSGLLLYPEMLSPEFTLELVHNIVDRSTRHRGSREGRHSLLRSNDSADFSYAKDSSQSRRHYHHHASSRESANARGHSRTP